MREIDLIGKKIITVRYMSQEELNSFGWSSNPLVIVLDDGTQIYASSDEEGNEAGCLFFDKDGKTYLF